MIHISRLLSQGAHGSRFSRRPGNSGIMKKKTADVIVGALMGMMKGESVTANWTDSQFVLRPGENREPARLEFTEIGSDEHGVLLIDYRSEIIDNGTSKKNGNFKFSISGKLLTGEDVVWDLKVSDEVEYREWIRTLTDCTKARWEQNTSACAMCRKPFGAFGEPHHCRRCGCCVCEDCSPGAKVLSTEGPVPVRVCNRCLREAPKTYGILG